MKHWITYIAIGMMLSALGACQGPDGQAEADSGQGPSEKVAEVQEEAPSPGNLSEVPAGNPLQPAGKNPSTDGLTEVTWERLKDVSFENKYVEAEDQYFSFPTFGEPVMALDGKKVFISGYLVPVDPDAKVYVLSAYNFASCFFCGNAGPESVMELNLVEEGKEFFTDQWATFSGTFRLNADDLNHLYYILEQAVEVPAQ